MSDHCASVTEEGAAVCVPGSCSCSSETQSSKKVTLLPTKVSSITNDEVAPWEKIRGSVMFAIACITSPCCTPIIVPIMIALLAGTPLAVLLSTYSGWVYGGLTLISAVSLVLGFHWLARKNEAKSFIESTRKSVVTGEL